MKLLLLWLHWHWFIRSNTLSLYLNGFFWFLIHNFMIIFALIINSSCANIQKVS